MTMRFSSRSPVFFSLLGLVALTFGGCIIPGNVGDDPSSGDDDIGGSSTTTGPGTGSQGHTSASTIPTTATSGGSFTASGDGNSASEVDGGDPTVGPLTEEEALDYCGVPQPPISPGGPNYVEIVECSEGCSIQVESDEGVDLFMYGACLCDAMDCGPLAGGTVGGNASVGDTEADTDSGGPDGCGPFPPGMETFTCDCEMCSIDVNDVDSSWLQNEADLEGICACMCGNTGCGLPV